MKELFEDFTTVDQSTGCGCKTCREAVEVDTIDYWNQPQDGTVKNETMVSNQVDSNRNNTTQNNKRYPSNGGENNTFMDVVKSVKANDTLAQTNYLSGSDSMVTTGSLAAGGNACNECVLNMVGYSQAYIPIQTTMNLLTPEASLCNGTAFRELVNNYKKGTGLKS